MKKYPTGFVPINFQVAGKVILVIGIISILLKVFDCFVRRINVYYSMSYFGLAFILLGLYLIFVVPKK